MSLKDIVKAYLENEPRARERKNKDRALVNLLIQRFPQIEKVEKEILIAVVQDYNSMDRAWRQILEHNEHLRGSDYDDKERLEQEKMVDLGYGDQRKLPI